MGEVIAFFLLLNWGVPAEPCKAIKLEPPYKVVQCLPADFFAPFPPQHIPKTNSQLKRYTWNLA